MDEDLHSLAACEAFAGSQSPSTIARRILQDQALCRKNEMPSLLVHCLPQNTDDIARAVSGDTYIPMSLARMRFSSIVMGIKTYLTTHEAKVAASDIPTHLFPTEDELHAALKVLNYLQLPQVDALRSTSKPHLYEIVAAIEIQLAQPADNHQKVEPGKRNCYICKHFILSPHKHYPSLCNPCGEFNIASSSISLPQNLDLSGKTCLVTGGRVNLGFHTALRLLRCGGRVIVTSRYPKDAEQRYLGEADSVVWKDRLSIVGADFRTAKDVFSLVRTVVACLTRWAGNTPPKLDILINNAAQTLTDSIAKEDENVRQEEKLLASPDIFVVGPSYVPRIRGGVAGQYHIQGPSSSSISISSSGLKDVDNQDEQDVDQPLSTIISTDQTTRSSWMQGLAQIPYEDVISAHSVNTFVPFILLRELLPYLSASSHPKSDTTSKEKDATKPQAYVINVSSREGLFELSPDHPSKAGHHVHTNMSKAALNMLTETEAGPAWSKWRVAINAVDPGYMSADPVYMAYLASKGAQDQRHQRVQECTPIGWEDGAGRVLWPIAKGERGEVVRGRFLKHFASVSHGVR
ncbi:hypothetical protein CVT24_004384 [Panaeolus cyanescens]|uniref:Uncharacterized protein n=1 Tax=Panaeolus cyanescens TaxID=181874 RepID=A0A409VDZ9_9AGAR|nr:hypothetical protein CVT24_004384 [Panaeolus cyanescens]